MKKENQVERGTIALYMQCFQNIKTFSGISGKGQCIILDNIEALGRITKAMQEAEERFIKTLQTNSVKQASEIMESFKGKTDLTDGDKKTLEVNGEILMKAEEELEKFKNEYYAVKVSMPVLEKISHEDFYVLAEKNAISPEEAKIQGAIGLYPQGISILKSLIY